MEIIKNELGVKLTKGQVTDLVLEALKAEDTRGIRRVLQPLLNGALTQCPEFSQAQITALNEDGTMDVTFKIPVVKTDAVEEDVTEEDTVEEN